MSGVGCNTSRVLLALLLISILAPTDVVVHRHEDDPALQLRRMYFLVGKHLL